MHGDTHLLSFALHCVRLGLKLICRNETRHTTITTALRQVARLCGTAMAAQWVAKGGLPLGASSQHSRQLLQQTREAMELQLRHVTCIHVNISQ